MNIMILISYCTCNECYNYIFFILIKEQHEYKTLILIIESIDRFNEEVLIWYRILHELLGETGINIFFTQNKMERRSSQLGHKSLPYFIPVNNILKTIMVSKEGVCFPLV